VISIQHAKIGQEEESDDYGMIQMMKENGRRKN
jgi:hypothetical protein